MPVTFVIGRAGSGKTARCFERIVELVRANPLGRPVWLVVPKQATFEYQREMVARLRAFTRVRVVGFDELGDEVLAEVGGVPAARVTAAGRRMIIGRLLYAHHDQLRYFASAARRPGLATAIDGLFDEFERSGKSLDELGDLIDQLGHAEGADGSDAPSLHAKLADLRLLYERYAEFVGHDRLDPQRRRAQVLRRLADSELLRHARVFVDAFYEFTENERQVLAAVATMAESVELNLTMDPASPVLTGGPAEPLSPFFRSELAYGRLVEAFAKAGVTVTAPTKLTGAPRFAAEPLGRIERRLFGRAANAAAPPPPSDDPPVVFLDAPDPRVEVQAVARRIRDLLRTGGYRQRDVVVLTRDLDGYLHLVHAAFAEHGLTYFADRRRPATHHPLVRLVRSAVRIGRDGWLNAAVLALAKSGLAGLEPDDIDHLDNYLHEHGITAPGWADDAAWQLAEHAALVDEEFVDTADPAPDPEVPAAPGDVPEPPAAPPRKTADEIRRHLIERLQPLTLKLGRRVTAPLRVFATELVDTLERFGVRQQLANWIVRDGRDRPEQAEEHEQVWAQLAELLQEMVDVLGDQAMDSGEFAEVLESGLDAFDLAITPPTLDQVLVGSVDRTRTLFPKVAFVLGLSRGVFPATHRDDSILSGPERRTLHKHRIDVEPDPRRRQLDERFLAYVGLTRASDRLILSRPRADEGGREYDESEFWAALRAIVPEAPVVREEPCTGNRPDCLSTPRDLVAGMLDWARGLVEKGAEQDTKEPRVSVPGPDGAPPPDAWRWELYGWIARRKNTDDALGRAIDRGWSALCYSNDATLSKPVAAQLFPSPLVATASQLETFASCPFKHFVAYGLRLAQRGAADITILDLSRVYHDTLAAVVQRTLELKQELAALPPDELAAFAAERAKAVAVAIRGQVLMDEARSRYLLGRVERTLGQILTTAREQLARGSFKPSRSNVKFGPGEKLRCPDLGLPDGGTLHLRGSIDRIDCAPDGGVAVYDYRMGDNKLSAADVLHGLNLRLLTCLLVLDRADSSADAKRLFPAAAFCARLLRSMGKVDHPEDAADPKSPEFALSAKPRGVVLGTHVTVFDKTLTTGSSEVLNAWINKDGTFGRRDTSDVADDAEFRTLIDFVEHKVRELAAGVTGGNVAVEPYLYHDASPCPRCDYRKVCRFEQTVNRYRKLEPMKRTEAITAMQSAIGGGVGEAGEGAEHVG
ncbi:MAG TPA: PD-(D/E)XK nuclease family protein [Humisphaera sp.]